MTVYADGNGIYGVGSNNINTNVNMTSGNHYIVVQAWDSHGNIYKSSGFNITVNSGGGGGGGGGNPTYSMIQGCQAGRPVTPVPAAERLRTP